MFSYPIQNHREQLIKALDISSGMNVLDLGCGSGAFLPMIYDAVSRKGHVTAVDINENNIQTIQEQFAETCETGSFKAQTLDISKSPLPFEECLFDRIFCQNVIECVNDKIALLDECFKILKPGGKILISHHDFDTAVYNSSFVELTRKLVHNFSDTTQDWQDVSDGQIGRKLSGLLTASKFGKPVQRGVMLIDEYEYAGESYGFNFSQWAVGIATKTGLASGKELHNWHQDLEAMDASGNYYFSICLMAVIGQKPKS